MYLSLVHSDSLFKHVKSYPHNIPEPIYSGGWQIMADSVGFNILMNTTGTKCHTNLWIFMFVQSKNVGEMGPMLSDSVSFFFAFFVVKIFVRYLTCVSLIFQAP